MGRDESLRYSGRLGPVEVFGDFRNQFLVGDDVLGVGCAAEQAEDSLAWLPLANRTAGVGDFSGKLNAWDLQGIACGRRILALALQQVGAVQGGGMHADQ